MSKLFESGKLGDIEVKNRVFMAPLTRNRALPDGTPNEIAIKYYAQRACAGLIITEATQISSTGKGYINTPGIHSDDHEIAWEKITDAVHAEGGKIVLQLWHVGRVSHNSLLPEGEVPVAPSAIKASTQTVTMDGFVDVSEPRELKQEEIGDIIKSYIVAADRAISAGFDGVEIHGANGYLINQFISTNTNKRTDQYGGSVENRARLLLDIVDVVSSQIGSGKVGVRLSPTGKFNDINDEEARETYSYILKKLNEKNLAYLHIVERFPGFDSNEKDEALIKELRNIYSGNYIANGNYSKVSASDVIEDGAFAVTFGRMFISNPDLPNRLKNGYDLVMPDEATLYGGDEKGYSDYPTYKEN